MSITIKHLDGNLAEGQPKEQTFGDFVDTITFGRERDCQVVYAPEYTVVGKRHCQLVRQVTGDYRVNLLGQRYVEVNGVPADNNRPWSQRGGRQARRPERTDRPSRSRSRSRSPICRTRARSPRSNRGASSMTDTRRLGTVVASVLGLVIAGSIAYFMLRTTSLEDQIAEANAAASARAQKEFSEATLARLEAAVYLVAKQEDQERGGRGHGLGLRAEPARDQRPRHPGASRPRGRFLPRRSRRHAYQDQEGHLASGLSRLRQVQDDARDDALRQFHPARPDQRI